MLLASLTSTRAEWEERKKARIKKGFRNCCHNVYGYFDIPTNVHIIYSRFFNVYALSARYLVVRCVQANERLEEWKREKFEWGWVNGNWYSARRSCAQRCQTHTHTHTWIQWKCWKLHVPCLSILLISTVNVGRTEWKFRKVLTKCTQWHLYRFFFLTPNPILFSLTFATNAGISTGKLVDYYNE